MLINLYTDFPFISFKSLFSELESLAQTTDDSSGLPQLELLLRNGHAIRGIVLTTSETNNQQVIMLLQPSDSYSKSEISFIYLNQVVGVRILEAEDYLKTHVKAAPQQEIGLLELKRAAKAVEEKLTKTLSKPVSLQIDFWKLPENHRSDVLRTIEALPSIFESLAADELGKTTLQEAVNEIEIKAGETSTTSLSDHTLFIQTVSPLTIPALKEKERLLAEIEGLL